MPDFCNFSTQSLFLLINTTMKHMITFCVQWGISWLMFGSIHICFKTKTPLALEDGVQEKRLICLTLPSKEKKMIQHWPSQFDHCTYLKEKYIGKVPNVYFFNYIHLIIKCVVANVVNFIVEQLPLYQQTIQSFKNDGYSIIGYARKSSTKESNETRLNLLNMMCKKFKMRSMVDKVFVSFKTSANDPIMDRDLNDDSKVLEKLDADGNTQDKNAIKVSSLCTPLMLKPPDMLRYVSAKKVCFVMLTFTALTTNVSDFETFLW